ncbi:hypothetical protein ACFX12_018687 [Malus domestica]
MNQHVFVALVSTYFNYLHSDTGMECNPCIWMVHYFLVTGDPAPTTVEDGYSRAILGKNKDKGKDREIA